MDWLTQPETYISLLTLTGLEIVLGIDNIVFISILAGKLPHHQQAKARQVGLSLALISRILLLCGLTWVMGLKTVLLTVLGHGVTGRDLILIVGGLFLLAKATREIHEKLEGEEGHVTKRLPPTFAGVIVQILLLDIVFSLDSVITAIGLARRLGVMIAAVVIAVGFMLLFAGYISHFIERHPTLKMLALSFLLLIGAVLVADGLGHHINKGYVYFAMAFSVMVEALNLKAHSKASSR
ncbi:MAG TPA: TerC family protein [Verrucomicrobiota bacterium]|nr:TerC family protein [Verrucomicrobiota bacterium]HRZ37569.1 TerC family protein [Candidatus Paceibacterota bacterium]HRZ56239.1 TerC family protein [Candidatus Paceibacterota bacterium]